ncbi:hypothetical protein CANARDRAFT_26844 [[Candida] arabinofermentans NRRL YB-2248]|uniref:Cell wall mannoprotein PIR1-like C-terminal domain-containing protein n=1 Tax=[Candida] arabinofermentans NRRL YB-2248 TaxID=983967 RepID=A0A1E4T6Q6_9ASCO|nr:hypothetical protein CANARDRAFT_26844 [[Candida] arabinofermentans NRRL YB-2248]
MKFTILSSLMALAAGALADDSWMTATPGTSLANGVTDMGSTTMGFVIQSYDAKRKSKRDDTLVLSQHCGVDGNLAVTLTDGILYDASGRVGSIVSNYQFQFDGPPPQSGYIYAAGWSIDEDGYLALGDSTEFFECLSGDFYNLYYDSVGDQCSPVEILMVELVDC